MKTVETLYDILDVSPQATVEDIKMAFRRLARETHPDRNPTSDALDRYKRATEAYRILQDPIARAAYDRERNAFGSIADFFGKNPIAQSVMTRYLPAAPASSVPGGDVRMATVRVSREIDRMGGTRVVTLATGTNIPFTVPARVPVSFPMARARWAQLAGQGTPGRHGAEAGDAWVTFVPEES